MDQPDKWMRARTLLPVVTGMLLMAGDVQAESYNLSTTILAGTCTVTSSDSVLTLPDVLRDDLNSGHFQQLLPLTLTTSACAGGGVTGTSPVLTVTGTTVPAPATVKDYLFNDGGTGSTALGYGIVVSTLNDTVWNTGNLVKNGGAVALTGINQDKTLYVGVGCGDAATCSLQDAGHAAGSLSAGITFTFSYQ